MGIECRADDVEMLAMLAQLHDPEAATCVAAERGVLVALGGDCKTPLGAHAERAAEALRLRAFISQPDGTSLRHAERVVPWPATEAQAQAIGLELGRGLI